MAYDLKDLIEQHDLLKEHPFRLSNDEKYLSNYAKEFLSFYKNVYEYLKGNKNYSTVYNSDKNFQAMSNMYHDFMKLAYTLQHHHNNISTEQKTDYILLLERVLMSIHFYLDNGYFKSYYVWSVLEPNKNVVFEYKYSNRNKWSLYMPKEKLKTTLDYYLSKPHEDNIYTYIIEYYQDLYDNYEKDWTDE